MSSVRRFWVLDINILETAVREQGLDRSSSALREAAVALADELETNYRDDASSEDVIRATALSLVGSKPSTTTS